MFGTLVIQLPSNYSGGKLIVYHLGMKSEFDYSHPDCCGNCYFTSFYADCQHEVEKVTKGYRLCLIYNLMYKGLDECPTAADNEAQVSAIVSAMKQWQEDTESDDCPDVMTCLLEHKYCEASLSFQLLKNGDRAVADVLAQAKAEVDFDFYVGHIKFTEYWAADHYCGRYKETEYGGESISAKHLKSSDGERTISKFDIDKSSLVPEDFFDALKPDEKEYEEATGNEGATVGKQYNWTALLLWPIKKRTAVIGVDNMIEYFKQDVDTGKGGLDDKAREVMREIRRNRPWFELLLQFLDILQVIDDTKLITEMMDVIASTAKCYYYRSFIENDTFYSSVMAIAHKHGWDILKSPLQAIFGECSSSYVEEYCTFLNKIIASEEIGHGKDLCTNLLGIIVKVLADEQDPSPSSPMWLYRRSEIYRSKEFVIQLFGLLMAVGSNDLFTSVFDTLRTKPVLYPVFETLGPAIVDFYKSTEIEKDDPLQVILAYCISQLKVSIGKVVAPTTNTKPVKFTCSCKDCIELTRFLKHPVEVQHRFKIGKERRHHLHQQLDSSGVDATHTTECVGNPRTFVVTKTNASYERDFKKQEEERALLASLQPLLLVTGAHTPSENEPPAKKQKAISKVVARSSSHVDLT